MAKRAKRLSEVEAQWPCLSAKDRDKKGFTARFIRYCDCVECKRVYDDIMGHALQKLRTEKP